MSLIPDVPALSDSIWPYDTGKTPDTSLPRRFDKFRCFVLCPFDRADLVILLVRAAAQQIERALRLEIEVYYAGAFTGPGPIHSDIWAHVKQADIVVADLTGFNPNVVYELGVAAAWRPIESVVLIRDESDGRGHVFDLSPVRHILYDSQQIGWSDQLIPRMAQDIWEGLSQTPFNEEPETAANLPMELDFSKGDDDPSLWSPGPGHRRIITNGLEFGSLYHFP